MTLMAKSGGSILQTYNAAERSIKSEGLKPVYLLAGRRLWADSYFRDRFIDKVKRALARDGNAEFTSEIFHASSDKAENIINSLSTANLFTDRKLIVIHDVQALNEQGIKSLSLYSKSPNLENCVILVSMNFDARKKWYSALKENLKSVKIETPFANQIPRWITLFADNRGKKISRDAAELIADYSGDTLQMLDMEMEKLSIFVGEKEWIEENDVKEAIGYSRQLSPFDLEKYFSNKDLNWTLSAIDNMLERGERPTTISITIFNFIMNTLTYIESGSDSASKWSPREQNKKDAARNWKPSELRNALNLVKESDFKIKQTKIPHRVIFTDLVLKMFSKKGEMIVRGN